MSTTPVRDDRILPATRVVAAGIIFILLLAVYALYINPDATDQNFAWTIKPRMMPMMMGAGYLMGAYFFARVLTARQWHRAAAGYLRLSWLRTELPPAPPKRATPRVSNQTKQK